MSRPRIVRELECKRCGHKWLPRKPEIPLCCPNAKCRSRYWNRPRRIRKSADEVARETREAAGDRPIVEKGNQ